jgi:putative sterol carrier protein
VSEPLTVFSPEWIDAFRAQVQSSASYKKTAATWEGDITLVIQADASGAVPSDLYIFMDLWHGECRDLRLVDEQTGRNAKFVITGGYARWKQVIQGELEPIKGLMQGKLKLKGNLAYIVRYVAAAKELVSCTTLVPTRFPDETKG